MQRRREMAAWLLLLIYVLASSIGMVFIKKGGTNTSIIFENGKFQIQISLVIIFGIVFYLFSFVLWMFILQLFTLTYISPVAYGITYIFIMGFSYIFLNEKISKQQLIGVLFIVIGIFIASIKKTK